MPQSQTVPENIVNDDRLARQFRVGLAAALSKTLDESDWKKFATLKGLETQITEHPRFLRSVHWNDPDLEGNVLDLVEHLYSRDRDALAELFLRDDVQRWLKRNDKSLLELWESQADPLIAALSHGVEELQRSMGDIDLSDYSRRIQASLPSDLKLALGATKEMLEATMRTILHRRGVKGCEKLDFPDLTTRCMTELGLLTTETPTSQAERYIRKIASTARMMIEAANELRNHAGTGHGKVVGEEPALSLIDVQLVAANGFILCAWLVRHSERDD